MNLSKTIVNKPTTVLIIFVVLAALGFYTLSDLPLDLLPDMELPYVVLMASYPGAGPEEVEKRVTRILESAISGVSGIEQVGSTSTSGSSIVYIQFLFGTNMDEAMNDVRASLDFVKRALPDEVTTPMIIKMDPNLMPIMYYSVSGNRSPEELRDFAEEIAPKLEQIEGVAQASVSGGREKAIIVEIPRDRLQAYNLTISQVSQMIAAQNIQIAGGTITEEDINYTISTVGEYASIEDIKNTVISYKMAGGGYSATGMIPGELTSVRLRDIADVYEGYKAQTSLHYLNGKPSVSIGLQKQSGKNSVQTARSVKAKMQEIIAEAPSDIRIDLTVDTTNIIERSISQVASSAIQGGLLAILILFVFLRSVRSTLIIGLTIPISLVITFGVMFFSGMTLNIMTLAGLALGIGMLVDNSIVVLENIYSYRDKGAKPKAAAILGSREMIMAITASTLTTICVFLPLIMYQKELGIIGEVFKGLSFTVVISLVCSLLVAVVLVPVLSSSYLKIGSSKEKKLKGLLGKLDAGFERFFSALEERYFRAIKIVLAHKRKTILAIIVLLGLSIVFIPIIGFEFMPESASDSISVKAQLPVGTKLETTEAVLRQLEQVVYREVQGIEHLTISVGSGGLLSMGSASSDSGTLTIGLPPLKNRIESEDEIKAILRRHFSDFPGVLLSIEDSSMMSLGGGGSAVQIDIKCENLDKSRDTARRIQEALVEEASHLVTEPSISLQDGLPQVNIVLDRERMYNLGLNVYTVGQEIKANIAGMTASRYREAGKETDIVLMLSEKDKTQLGDLEQIFVTNASGVRIPVSSFAKYEAGLSPIAINRNDQTRVVSVNMGLQKNLSITKVQREVEALVQKTIPYDPEIRIEYGGDYAALVKAIKQFIIIIIMAIILVFAVMASQFESLLDPFIVLFTMPLMIVGIVFVYALTGLTLNVMTAVGVLILVGIIVNNGIVLVDYTNLLRKRGLPLIEACAEAGRSRLRPILMTTLTTILGLVPMAFFPGEGSEMVQPIGQTVLGGLSFGTLMTLFLMPVLYAIFNQMRGEKIEKN